MLRPVHKLLRKAASFYAARIETEPLLKSHLKTFAESTCNIICMYLESNLCRGSNGRASEICILELDREPGCRDVMRREKEIYSWPLRSLLQHGTGVTWGGSLMTDIFLSATASDLADQLLSAPVFYITSVFRSLDLKNVHIHDRPSSEDRQQTKVSHHGLTLGSCSNNHPFPPPRPPGETCLLFME